MKPFESKRVTTCVYKKKKSHYGVVFSFYDERLKYVLEVLPKTLSLSAFSTSSLSHVIHFRDIYLSFCI